MESVFNLIIAKRFDFYSALSCLDNINLSYNGLRKQMQSGQKIENSYYASFISSSIGSINNLVNTYSKITEVPIPNKSQVFLDNLQLGSDLCIDIQQRNFPGIFNEIIKLLSESKIFKDESLKKVQKYLSFAANISSASNSEEMKEAVNSVALPPGSFSVKQNSKFNISVNSYIGYGYDFNFATSKNPVFSNGIYAPLGLSFSWGLGKNKKGGALTLFIGFIDVGAIASFRLANGFTDSLKQEVRLESLISPSTQLLYEIPKTPIAICAGWRFTPKLFYTTGSTLRTVAAQDVFNLSVLIDIPMVTLKNTPHKN
jgi:hypothetical protein